MEKESIKIKVLGTRGSYPVSSKDKLLAGGNTSSFHIEIEDKTFIFDAGTGIIGDSFVPKDRNIHLFFTHYHWDHIIGLPFFPAIFDPSLTIHVYGGKPEGMDTLEQVIKCMFEPPFSPLGWHRVEKRFQCKQIKAKDKIIIDNIIVTTIPLHHPQKAIGYKLTYQKKAIAIITDIEIEDSTSEEKEELINFLKEVDIVIMDGALTEDQYLGDNGEICRIGWGHSTWKSAVEIGKRAKVGKLVIHHHEPGQTDKAIKALQHEVEREWKQAIIAYEGDCYSI